MFKKIFTIALITMSIGVSANEVVVSDKYNDSGKRFYDERNRGFFAYEDLPSEIKKKIEDLEKKVAELTAKKEAETPKPFSAKWFNVNLSTYRNKAIDNPTEKNVLTIKLMEKVMRQKAMNFATQNALVSVKYPVFNATTPTGNNTSLKDQYYKNRARDILFEDLAKSKVFWFFYSSNCPQCDYQAATLNGVAQSMGWNVLAISMDGKPLDNGLFPNFVNNNGHAQKLGLMALPATYVMDPKTLDISNVSQNAIARPELINRTMLMAKDMKWISEDDFDMTTKVNQKNRLSTEDINKIDFSNPDQLNDHLIELITSKGVR